MGADRSEASGGRHTGAPARWTQALEAASRLAYRCQTVSVLRGRQLPVTDSPLWALAVYAIAGACGQAPGDVSAAQLRFRLEDETAYQTWLCAALQRLGHHVHAPEPPAPDLTGGLRADDAMEIAPLAAELTVWQANQAPTADDPVAALWRAASLVTTHTTEMTDGATVALPPRSRLHDARRAMCEALDDTLIAERGGWPAGTPVRIHGAGEHITPDGRLAGEYGVAPNRAWVATPVWTLDHARHTLAAGPPVAYRLRWRPADPDRITLADPSPPVAVRHLSLDLDPLPDPADRLRLPETLATPRRAATTGPAETAPAAGDVTAPAPSPPASTGQGGEDSSHKGSCGEDPARRVRASALRRLYWLHDTDMERSGDATPLRVAERIAAGHIPAPPVLTFRYLDETDQLAADRHPPWQQATPARLADMPPARRLVDGQRRQMLLDWLPHVTKYWTTPRQRSTLDGLGQHATVADATGLLGAEGFTPAGETAGPAEGTPRGGEGREVFGTEQQHLTVWAHIEAGWLATLSTRQPTTGQPTLEEITVWYCVEPLDEQMLAAGLAGGYHASIGERHCAVWYGCMRVRPRQNGGGSLRVCLAALRAFARPILPWHPDLRTHLAGESLPVFDTLPAPIGQLLGLT